ncbi:MAG: alpha/beta hydrolase [Pseudomonadota bacterium]|nr:alpha/beta hydrolase [Pseudomonadota bacterium]
MQAIDNSVFLEEAITRETAAINRIIVERLKDWDQWARPVQETREMRARGEGPFPLGQKSERAETLTIERHGGKVELRIISPERPRGAFLHIHGGGWVFGSAQYQDPYFERLAANCGIACVSVEYRLAPENPYPAANDDCEAAALWLAENAARRFGCETLLIGGESAGAHLCVTTLLRLRDRHGLTPFRGAVLNAGMYDLTLTPSVRNWGTEKLILNTRDIETFVGMYAPEVSLRDQPDLSPLYADLNNMPAAQFIVGTRDPLLDDSLFMAERWRVAGNSVDLAPFPGGAHVFTAFAGQLQRDGLARIEAFICERLESQS